MRHTRKAAVSIALGCALTLAAACSGGATTGGSGGGGGNGGGGGGGGNTKASSGQPSGGGGGGSGKNSALTISNEAGSLWTCGFNPFNPSTTGLSIGIIYEPLMFVNALRSQDPAKPWLATKYAWSNGNKTLTFTTRSGVKFTNGDAFGASDVAYTFNLMKAHPALDLNAVWSVLTSVKAPNATTVVFTFKSPSVPYFYYVADQVGIVSQKVWSQIKDPINEKDAKPIGTGAYLMHDCTPQNIKYTKNTSYWQPGLPKVTTVNYPAFTSNDPANTYLRTGQAQWGGQFIPNIDAFYTKGEPDHHYWFPPVSNVAIFINQKDPVLKDVAVRQALAYGIDRDKVSNIGEYGYEPAANQTGIVTPTFSSWLDGAAEKKWDYKYNPDKVSSILSKAGYKKSGDVWEKNGKKLEFSILNVGGNSDWVASLQVVQQNLAKVGIKLTIDNLSGTEYGDRIFKGKYQLAYDAENGGPTPYYELRELLYSKNSAPIGQQASSNWERFIDPNADNLLNQYASASSTSEQQAIVKKLEAIMLEQVPVIPVTESVDWYQYDTKAFSGWVTKDDQYAQPAPYRVPDLGVVLLHLTPN
ncbi:MAG: ABC transporter substrate-binding protein [Mycobacteriales bacterium]